MKFKEAKDVFFNSKKIRLVLAGMALWTQEEIFKCFFHCPTKFALKRVDGSEINLTVRVYLDLQDSDKDGKDNLVDMFFRWKERFDGFEKKVLDILPDNSGRVEYLFLRSSTFLTNRESWEKEGVENSEFRIRMAFIRFKDKWWEADENLGKYYIIHGHRGSTFLVNMYSHQLYHLMKTTEILGLAGGNGYSLVPLMVKYEDVYETPIEEREVWDGEFWNYQKGMLGFSVLFSILSKT